ncbi:EF-hand domain-containing protein [Pseudodesulfovibrio piezophilus]|uniref:Putative Calcium-binding EF-hand-containing protein n=1 Tax=Pseudodesulfovibrio piezophilus (strain DSM 21447 / JCM 15486 / C1TLV30) TaxID=1322246 RepID=M1WSH1_PSEP2|nr:EF-hand domain-containing protein [Pseudodesulfovibrio piezophilus]CCH50194.1 putative Calcium-binding EF-hand-containing protein [Pseudodesulfovibrio piezophilus C1TLV30]
MEISSVSSMSSMMSMQSSSMQAPPEPPDTSEMSSDFISALDSDGDGALSETEFAAGGSGDSSESSEVFDALDTNEDGIVSQDEIEADMEARQATMESEMESSSGFSGIQQTADTAEFEQLMSLVGSGTESQSSGTEAYSQMQDSLFGSSSYDSQSLSGGLSIRA